MRILCAFAAFLIAGSTAMAQPPKKDEDTFVKEKPTIGDTLPDLTIYTPDGKEVKTTSWRGHHTVLVFGCLT